MNIISQKESFVNSAKEKKSVLDKWTDKKTASLKVARRMIDAGFIERGKRMQFCGHFLNMKKCPTCGKNEISSANLCRDKLCPTCQWRLSLKRFAEMCATVSYIDDLDEYRAGFLTLTVKNCSPCDLRYTLQTMSKDWNRFLNQRWAKKMLVGSARSVEITFNPFTRTFHPHFHIITLTKPEYDEGFLRGKFNIGWQNASRLDYVPVTDFKFIKADEKGSGRIDDERLTGAILETFKYATKSDDLESMPLHIFRQFVTAIQGVRFTSFTGIIKEARKQLGYKDSEDDFEEVQKIKCDCGSSMMDACLAWSFEEKRYKEIKESFGFTS